MGRPVFDVSTPIFLPITPKTKRNEVGRKMGVEKWNEAGGNLARKGHFSSATNPHPHATIGHGRFFMRGRLEWGYGKTRARERWWSGGGDLLRDRGAGCIVLALYFQFWPRVVVTEESRIRQGLGLRLRSHDRC